MDELAFSENLENDAVLNAQCNSAGAGRVSLLNCDDSRGWSNRKICFKNWSSFESQVYMQTSSSWNSGNVLENLEMLKCTELMSNCLKIKLETEFHLISEILEIMHYSIANAASAGGEEFSVVELADDLQE